MLVAAGLIYGQGFQKCMQAKQGKNEKQNRSCIRCNCLLLTDASSNSLRLLRWMDVVYRLSSV